MASKYKKNCRECRIAGDSFFPGDEKCRACWGSGKDSIKQFSKIFTDIPLGLLGIDNNSDEDCQVCSGTGQCQTCGGEGVVYVDFDDENENECIDFVEEEDDLLDISSSLDLSYDYDDTSSSYSGDSYSNINTNKSSNYGWYIFFSILLIGYFGIKNLHEDLSEKSKPKLEIENFINKIGYVDIKSEGRVQVYPTANMHSVESYYVYGREKVDVISFFPKYETYKIKNEFNQIGFIDDMFITFEDITKEYSGKVYREFYFKNISLTEDDRNEIKLFINELKEYSDDYEILSYDYLNQEAVAHHRGQDVFYLFDMSGIRNQFKVIVKFWNNDSKKTNNLIIIKSKEYNKELN